MTRLCHGLGLDFVLFALSRNVEWDPDSPKFAEKTRPVCSHNSWYRFEKMKVGKIMQKFSQPQFEKLLQRLPTDEMTFLYFKCACGGSVSACAVARFCKYFVSNFFKFGYLEDCNLVHQKY